METYSHAFFTWALAKHGVKTGRAAGIAGAVGATLPDMPSIAGTAYYIGMPFLREGWSSMDSEAIRDPIYVSGPFGATGVALHSAVPPLALLLLYVFLNLGSRDHRKILLWFMLGWLGHAVADFLTHVDGAFAILAPLGLGMVQPRLLLRPALLWERVLRYQSRPHPADHGRAPRPPDTTPG